VAPWREKKYPQRLTARHHLTLALRIRLAEYLIHHVGKDIEAAYPGTHRARRAFNRAIGRLKADSLGLMQDLRSELDECFFCEHPAREPQHDEQGRRRPNYISADELQRMEFHSPYFGLDADPDFQTLLIQIAQATRVDARGFEDAMERMTPTQRGTRA
jgi:hypothetical protein